MKPFRFRLESVLRYRSVLVTGEEARLAMAKARLEQTRKSLEALHALQHSVEQSTLSSSMVTGSDLRALSAWQIDMKRQVIEAERTVEEAKAAFEAQLERVRHARREHRLLENLREKRLEEWTVEMDKEIEELAASSFLARWGKK